jgi:hypothetical protein
MTKQQTIEALDYLIEFFKQFNELLDKRERKLKELQK